MSNFFCSTYQKNKLSCFYFEFPPDCWSETKIPTIGIGERSPNKSQNPFQSESAVPQPGGLWQKF